MMTTGKTIVLLFLVFIILGSLSIYRHKNIPANTFRSELWVDKAGYYVYLPSTILYHFQTEKFPEKIDSLEGNGFSLSSGKVVTKYTYGVALLELPFFICADFLTTLFDYPKDGFSLLYRKVINIAAAFYLTLGLYLLFLSLKVHYNYNFLTLFITLLILFFGTNLYYYGIMDTGMSHVYSFFLFSSILYLVTHKGKYNNKYTYNIFLSLLIWFIILIRPTNIIFALIPFIWSATSLREIVLNIRCLISVKILIIWVLTFFVIFTPQFIYWKYAFGHYFVYSYMNEGFSNFLSPRFAELLFSPNNGLLPYSLIFIGIFCSFFLLFNKNSISIFYQLFTFLLICYLTTSWHERGFGCGAGMRNMVEYYSLFAFPLCFFINKVCSIKIKSFRFSMYLCIGLLVLISFKVNYHYYGCYLTDVHILRHAAQRICE